MTLAPWRKIPTSSLVVDTVNDYADRFVLYHSYENMPQDLRCYGKDYGFPEIDITTATGTVTVVRRPGYNGPINRSTVPWKDSWLSMLATGSDRAGILRNYSNGLHVGLWAVDTPFYLGPIRYLPVGACYTVKDPFGNVVDIDTYLGNFPGATGSGCPPDPITKAELDAGEVLKVVGCYIRNACKGTGGTAVSPAGQYEQRSVAEPVPNWNEDIAIPEGTRFGLDPAVVTDEYIEDWLDSRSYIGVLRTWARAVAVALRDYGWFISATGPNAGFQFDGITGLPSDLMYGLIDNTNVLCYEPPVSTLKDGTTTQSFGYAVSIAYESVPTATTPAAPTINSITSSSSTLTVNFTAGSNGGSAITNYQYSTDNGATWVTRSPSSTTTPLVITGLVNGTGYMVKLRAVNAIGTGAASAGILATPVTTPSAPSITGVTPSPGAFSVAFTAPASNGGSAILTYQYSTDAGTTWRNRDSGTTASPLVIATLSSDGTTALDDGTDYPIELRAVNAQGPGAASAVFSGTTPEEPEAPAIGSTLALNGAVVVSYTVSSNGGSAITAIEYRLNGGSWVDALDTTSPFTISGLTNGTPYDIEIRAVNGVGASPASNLVSATPAAVPGAPTINSITPADASLIVAFTPGSTGGSAITSYEYSTNGGSSWSTASGTSSPITITGLVNGTPYSVQLRARNAQGAGPATPTVVGTPAGDPVPSDMVGQVEFDLPIYTNTEWTASGTLVVTGDAGAENVSVSLEFLAANLGDTVDLVFDGDEYLNLDDTPRALGDLEEGTYDFTVTGREIVTGPGGSLIRVGLRFTSDNTPDDLPADYESTLTHVAPGLSIGEDPGTLDTEDLFVQLGPDGVVVYAHVEIPEEAGAAVYTFTFGDETPAVGPQASPDAFHRYTKPGVYELVASATDVGGGVATNSLRVHVSYAEAVTFAALPEGSAPARNAYVPLDDLDPSFSVRRPAQ